MYLAVTCVFCAWMWWLVECKLGCVRSASNMRSFQNSAVLEHEEEMRKEVFVNLKGQKWLWFMYESIGVKGYGKAMDNLR